jgi:hypothetical protein
MHRGRFSGDQESADTPVGTAMLSLLAGNTASGTPGLIPGANYYVAEVFSLDREGLPRSDAVSILTALDWMEALDVKIISLNFSGPHDPIIEEALARMARKGGHRRN